MDTLQDHLRNLQGLYERLDEDHPSRKRVADRIAECEQDIANDIANDARKTEAGE